MGRPPGLRAGKSRPSIRGYRACAPVPHTSSCDAGATCVSKRLRGFLPMVVVLDTVNDPPKRPRHPEKAHRPDTPALKKPDWIRVRAPVSRGYAATRDIVRAHRLHTVCEEAGCPNIGECWDKKHATFMIMGDTCTRACAFCNVRT